MSSAKRVLVLGATGSVGRILVPMLVSRGCSVTVLVRDRGKLAGDSAVRIFDGDAFDSAVVSRAAADQDVVVYALGSRRLGPTRFFSESTAVLLEAMQRHGVRRLVAITGVGAGDTKGHGGFLYDRILHPLFTRKIYEDKDRQEALIRRSSVEWIIVRPAPFRERRRPRGPLQAVVDVHNVTLRSITRAEVAAFIAEQLESDRFLRQTPFVGHP
jgi:putative NADH-flavin reductase